MNDDDLDAALRAAMQYDPSRAGSALEMAGPDLLEVIMSTPHSGDASLRTADLNPALDIRIDSPPAAPSRRRRRILVAVAVAASVVLAVAVPSYVFQGDHSPAGRTVTVAPARAPHGSKNAPNGTRVLVSATGWTVDMADQSDPHSWDVNFRRGSVEVSISAFPASEYSQYLKDRHVTASTPTVAVLGTRAPLIRQASNDWETLVPPHLGQVLDVQGSDVNRADMIQVLERLRWVDEATWETAMPTNMVTPSRELTVAEQMLRGIPLPSGMTAADMVKGFTNDRYQFAGHVTAAVACRWTQLDLQARTDGDQEARRQADAAMASTHEWPILKQINAQGGWSDSVWEFADILTKRVGKPGGPTVAAVAASYRQEICDV
jgi:hypothetical protein